MMSEFVHGNCPHCGNALQIPADLEEFACLYCGKRCRTEVMLALNVADTDQYTKEREYLNERLVKAVVNYPDYHKKITKKDFFRAFETYEADNAKILEHLDVCARLDPDGKEKCIEKICTELLDHVDAHLMGDVRWAKKSKREQLLFETRVVLAIFLTPLVRKRKLETAELFREELNRQWRKRYPTHKWTPGDYEVLAGGFRKRKLCFITTATCLHEGKSDTCDELQAFRAFRDGYLTAHDGAADIERYYDIAPSIVTCIDFCDDSKAAYEEIRTKWLNPCSLALQENRLEDCRMIYTNMVNTLQKKYLQ
ncbi:MAG: hypothetical protein E7434_03430 [Ruminococcaceae bacterium]|nr:hypothetical protein [Oscillospiraceae bacterium]